MRKIEAIIRKSKFKMVKRALMDGGFKSFNYNLTRCVSEETDHRFYRGVEYVAKADDRVVLTIIVNHKKVKEVLDIIQSSGFTGSAKDSYIGVYKPEKMYRIVDDNDNDKLFELI